MPLVATSFGLPLPGATEHHEVFVDWDQPRICGIATNTPSEVAGENPVEVMRRCLERVRSESDADPLEALLVALDADLNVLRRASDPEEDWGLWRFIGEAVFLTEDGADLEIAAVGAMRVIRLRDGKAVTLFDGHTFAAQTIAQGGAIAPEHAHMFEKLRTSGLGVRDQRPTIHRASCEGQPGDRYLLVPVETVSGLPLGRIARLLRRDLRGSAKRIVDAGCAAYQAQAGRPIDGQAMVVEVGRAELPPMRTV